MLPSVYKLTLLNDTNSFKKGTVYVGQQNGNRKSYFTGGVIPSGIIKKYGKKIFKKEILVEGNFDKNTLDTLEKHYIKIYDSVNNGLNIALGGKIGVSVPNRIIYQYNIDGKFEKEHISAIELAKKLNVHESNIYRYAKNNSLNNSIKGIRVSYIKYDKLPKIKHSKIDYINIYKYDLNGNYIESFKLVQDAIKSCDIKTRKSTLLKVLDTKRIAAGFQWRSYKVNNCGMYTETPGSIHKQIKNNTQ